jgi:hypothetical protein
MKVSRVFPMGVSQVGGRYQHNETAREILRAVPHSIYPALLKHMKEHANLFTAAILAIVAGGVASKSSPAEALFS